MRSTYQIYFSMSISNKLLMVPHKNKRSCSSANRSNAIYSFTYTGGFWYCLTRNNIISIVVFVTVNNFATSSVEYIIFFHNSFLALPYNQWEKHTRRCAYTIVMRRTLMIHCDQLFLDSSIQPSWTFYINWRKGGRNIQR